MWEIPSGHPLRRLFAGLTEHAFLTNLGVADPPLVDYISEMLSRFVHSDCVYRLRDSSGQPMTELISMAIEADKLPSEGRTRREYHRHVGDFALFWTGIYPEAVNRLQQSPCKDHVVSFTTLGKRSYLIASNIVTENDNDTPILRRLGEQFELCAYGLREVRREWEELAHHPSQSNLLIQ